MKIEIDSVSIILNEQRLIYDLYYFVGGEFEGLTETAIVKKILAKWAGVLIDHRAKDHPLFLPYNLEDESVECLRAIQDADKIILRLVRVNENGWAVDVNDLGGFMISPHEILEESPDAFAEYNKDEFIAGLVNARVINS